MLMPDLAGEPVRALDAAVGVGGRHHTVEPGGDAHVVADQGVPAEQDLVALTEIDTPEIDLSDLDDLEGTLELLRESGVLP